MQKDTMQNKTGWHASIWKPMLILILAVCFSAPGNAQETGTWKVDSTAGECLLDNLPKYINQNDDPVVIVFSLCPNANQELASNSQTTNSGLPEVNDSSGSKKVIVMNISDLKCLQDSKVTTVGQIMLIPKDPCLNQ